MVIVHNPEAVDAFRPNRPVVRSMIDQGITNLTRKPTVTQAWLSLVSTQDVVGIKVYSSPGPNSGTRPAVVAGVVEGLLAAGLSPSNIVIWDKQLIDLRLAGYFDIATRYGVRVLSSADAGFDEQHSYDNALIGNLVWGDHEFGLKGTGRGRKSYVSKLVSKQLTKIIHVSPLLNNNVAGVSGCIYSLVTGSVDNVSRFEWDPQAMAMSFPDIYGLEPIADKVVLNVVDALVCQYEGGERGLLHYSTTLNELRFSSDPVALDVLSVQELDRQRKAANAPEVKPNLELYNLAGLLHGIDDLKRIRIERFDSPPTAGSGGS